MSGELRKIITVAELDAEIDRLTNALNEQKGLIADPQQRENRRKRREQLAGRWVVTCALEENHLKQIRVLAGAEAWLFESSLLQSDGWVKNNEGRWTLPPRQSPTEGAGP